MSNKTISEIPEITDSAFAKYAHEYYVMVEKADGTLYKMLANEAFKNTESLGSFVFFDGEKKIYTFASDSSADSVKVKQKTAVVDLSKHGVPANANLAIISIKNVGGNYPRYSIKLNGVDAVRWHGVGHHWTQQYTVPIIQSQLEIILEIKRAQNSIEFFMHGYG